MFSLRTHLLLTITLGVAVRLWRLGSKSLWLDEALLLVRLQKTLGQFAIGEGEPYHPPLYYEFMRWWVLRLGESEIGLRLPSVFFSILVIPLIFVLGKKLNFSAGQIVSATWLTSLSPLLVWYAQEARSYAFLSFLHVLGAVLLVFWVTQREKRPAFAAGLWVSFVVTTALSLYLHYAAVLIIPIQIMVLIALYLQGRSGWQVLIGWIAGWLAAVVLFIPWLQTPVMQQFMRIIVSDRFYLAGPISEAFGLPYSQVRNIGLVVFMIASSAAVILLYYFLRRYGKQLYGFLTQPNVVMILAFGFILSLIAILFPRAYSLKRQLSAVWPFFLLVTGWLIPWSLDRVKGERPWALALILLSFLATVINVTLIPKAEWREAAAFLEEHMDPADTLILMPGYNDIVFRYYNDEGLRITDVGNPIDEALQEAAAAHETIWYLEDQRDLTGPRVETRSWLEGNMNPVATERFYLLTITRFE